MIVCTRCITPKESSEFYPRNSNSKGVRQPCKDCTREINKRDRNKPGRRERKRDVSRAYYRRGDVREKVLAKSKQRRRQDHLKYKFGLTKSEVADMRESQCDLCEICRRPFQSTPSIDHDHKTGTVRALLCRNCNIGLGQFHDDPIRLQAAAEYLLYFTAE